jgi:hypothetical protein
LPMRVHVCVCVYVILLLCNEVIRITKMKKMYHIKLYIEVRLNSRGLRVVFIFKGDVLGDNLVDFSVNLFLEFTVVVESEYAKEHSKHESCGEHNNQYDGTSAEGITRCFFEVFNAGIRYGIAVATADRAFYVIETLNITTNRTTVDE